MIRRLLVAAAAPAAAIVTARPVLERLGRRIVAAPRHAPGEESLGPAIDALGGEVVRLRARDGLRLTGRWLPAERLPEDAASAIPEGAAEAPGPWTPDPREAILLLHGWSGSIAPDLVEYGPFLRRTANVLGLDFRGHGGSDDAPTTFGMREAEDVAGALAWLGERGIARVALFGTSMGGMAALAAVAILGDGRLEAADLDPDAPAAPGPPPRPRIVAVVADSVGPEIAGVVGRRMPIPFGRAVAGRALGRLAGELGGDPRETQPIRVMPLLEDLPLLLLHGDADDTVPLRDARRLAAAAPAATRHVVLRGAGHSTAHAHDPERYEAEVGGFLREALEAARPVRPGKGPGYGEDPGGTDPEDRAPILSPDTPPGDAHGRDPDGATG